MIAGLALIIAVQTVACGPPDHREKLTTARGGDDGTPAVGSAFAPRSTSVAPCQVEVFAPGAAAAPASRPTPSPIPSRAASPSAGAAPSSKQPSETSAAPSAAGATAPRARPDPEACIARARQSLARDAQIIARTGGETLGTLRSCVKSLLDSGDAEAALAVAKAGNELFPAEPQSGFDYGAVLLLAQSDLDAARTVLQNSLARKGRFTRPSEYERALAINNLGRIALDKGEIGAARARFREALRLDDAYGGILYNLAAADQMSGDAAACFENIQRALLRTPELATHLDYLVAAWAHLETNHAGELAILMRRAIASFPNAAGLHQYLGRALARSERPVQAMLEFYYESMNDAADDPFAEEARGALRAAAAAPASASEQVRDATTWVATAISEADADGEKALPILDKLDAAGYMHVVTVFLRARALRRAGRTHEAEEVFRKCLVRDPAFLPAYYDLSVLLREAGKDQDARALVAEAVRRNPAHWELTGVADQGPPE